MAAIITIKCPECNYEAGLRFDPGPEDDAPGAALAEVTAEHPDHRIFGGWKFRERVNEPTIKEN